MQNEAHVVLLYAHFSFKLNGLYLFLSLYCLPFEGIKGEQEKQP